MEHSRSRITFADDLNPYRLPSPPHNDSVVEPSSPPPPREETVSPEEQQLTLNSCVDELVNILGTSLSRSVMVQSLLRHDLNFELALDEILQSGASHYGEKGNVDATSSISRITPSPPPSRPDPRSSPEFWSDESGGGNGAEAIAPIIIGDAESRGMAYRQENVADMLGFSDVLSSRLTSSLNAHRDAESTLEDYCSSRISSPDVCFDARDLSAMNKDVDAILTDARAGGNKEDLGDLAHLLVDQVKRIKVKSQSRFSKKKGFQKLRPLDEMGNGLLSYYRLTTEMRREMVKAKLIVKKPAPSAKRRDEADVWKDSTEALSKKVSGSETAKVIDHYEDSNLRQKPSFKSPKTLQIPSPNTSPSLPLTQPSSLSLSDSSPLELEDFLASRWAAEIQALRLERIAIKKLPQLKKAKCKSPSWQDRDSPLWTYARFSRSLVKETSAVKCVAKASEETASIPKNAVKGKQKKQLNDSAEKKSDVSSSPSVNTSNFLPLHSPTSLQVPASTSSCLSITITTSSPTPPSSSLPQPNVTSLPKQNDEDDLDFLDDDFESVSTSLRKKPALPQSSPLRSAVSSNYHQYFAQGARPKGSSVVTSSSSVAPKTPLDKSEETNESDGEQATKSLPVISSPTPVSDTSADASRPSRPSVLSSSSTSSVLKSPALKSSASKSPSPSPLSRMGKGLSLQQLAKEHAKNRSTRSQSPLTKPQQPRLDNLGEVADGSKLSSSDFRKLSAGSGGSPSRLCSWESSPSLDSTSSISAKSSTAQKPSLSALSSLAKAHTSVMSGGSLLKSLETLNLAKMTAEGTLRSRHLGSVLGLPGFQDISLTEEDDEAVRRILRSVSVLDVGIFDGPAEVGCVSEKENAEDGKINVKKRFLYRRQRSKVENKKSKPSPKKSPSKASAALSANPFSFATPSPDDVVSEKQKMAFEHTSETTVLSTAVTLDKTAKTVSAVPEKTSADGEEGKISKPSKAEEKVVSKPRSTSYTEKKSSSEIPKEVSPDIDDEDSGPDDWESHYFGS